MGLVWGEPHVLNGGSVRGRHTRLRLEPEVCPNVDVKGGSGSGGGRRGGGVEGVGVVKRVCHIFLNVLEALGCV